MHVTIQNFAFSPQTITVAPGTAVIWINKDSVAHTVTADDGAWGSGNLATSQTFSHTFAKAGTYPYHCAIHTSMTARVIVSSSGMSGGSMTGKTPSKAVALGRDDQINDLAKKGVLTLNKTKTVLNCPIIKVMSGSTSGSHSGSGY